MLVMPFRSKMPRCKKCIKPISNRNRNVMSSKITDSLILLTKIGKILGIFPIRCIKLCSDDNLEQKSRVYYYSSVVCFINFWVVLVTFIDWIYSKFLMSKLGTLVFNIEIFLSTLCFIHLTTRWYHIMSLWNIVDKKMVGIYKDSLHFNFSFKIIFLIYALMSVGNHIGTPMHSIFSLFITDENQPVDITFLPEYNNVISKILTIHSILGKTVMHYRDIFIIMIAVMLKAKFKQINERIRGGSECFCAEIWKDIREDYDRLAHLVKELEKDLSYLTTVSVGCNGYWILNFFYKTYEAKFSSSANLFFLYPFGYILLRFFYLFYYSAELNSESQEPSTLIQFSNIPIFNTEISRLLRQVEFDNVYLSGCNIFQIKKGVILNLLGSIITYELTLLQYNVFNT